MTEPLALLLYERVLPGGQLANRLRDMGYRVITLAGTEALLETAEREKPLVLIVDLGTRAEEMRAAIGRLRRHGPTAHLRVMAIVPTSGTEAERAAREAGADLVVSDSAVQLHFKQLLEQALGVD